MIEIVEPIYKMSFDKETSVLSVDFGAAADNDAIVKEVKSLSDSLVEKVAGSVLRINGRTSMPVAMVLAHSFAHVVKAVGAWDPKLQKYVIVISHDPNHKIGDLID